MIGLVADVGGTNTRLALARSGRVDTGTIKRFANDSAGSFMDLVHLFLEEQGGRAIDAAAIAVAGPVTAAGAQLTNRDWWIDAGMLAPVAGQGPVRVLNDLKALGYALPGMQASDLDVVSPRSGSHVGNGQSLVVGIGTGFNVSPVLTEGEVTTCMDTEYGHTALPRSVAGDLDEAGFETVEDCFSGRGFAALRTRIGEAEIGDRYAGLMAAMARELVLAFMPLDGLYFAGSVARAVMQSEARDRFRKDFARPFDLREDLSGVPVSIITDDFAPLNGCAQVLRGLEPG
ncbi:glucokinase [Thalassococcus sp. S3]|uniref:glucokinase n=1 Tax=Thalassococcus sp. S3 TaxID=2017482 RepID=UPI0013EE85DC|nr:glucokinase [Thalassococcus sp. S3]